MHNLFNLLNTAWWRFEWRYWRHQTPWDTQITPPEVLAYIRRTRPGRVLDMGCGTGTNAVTLTQNGWQTVGVDFSPKAIAAARRKAAQLGLAIQFYLADVADLGFLHDSFDYIFDIGCLFALTAVQQKKYAAEITRLLKPGGDFMLYAWLPRSHKGKIRGISSRRVADLFQPALLQTQMVKGRDGPGESAWYWFSRQQ